MWTMYWDNDIPIIILMTFWWHNHCSYGQTCIAISSYFSLMFRIQQNVSKFDEWKCYIYTYNHVVQFVLPFYYFVYSIW